MGLLSCSGETRSGASVKPIEEYVADHDQLVRELFDEVMAIKTEVWRQTGRNIYLTDDELDMLARAKLKEWEAR